MSGPQIFLLGLGGLLIFLGTMAARAQKEESSEEGEHSAKSTADRGRTQAIVIGIVIAVLFFLDKISDKILAFFGK